MFVTTKIGAYPCITSMHDSTTSVERNKFLFTGLQPWGGGAGSIPLPSTPLLPMGL